MCLYLTRRLTDETEVPVPDGMVELSDDELFAVYAEVVA